MLFNSAAFIFLFLPAVLLGFYALGRKAGHRTLLVVLLLAALVFYASGAARHLPLLIASVLFNYAISRQIHARGETRVWLTIGVTANLALLACFKYSPLLHISGISGSSGALPVFDLPVGISFYTFTQISYLVDLHRRKAQLRGLQEYAAFVSYFPHLVAGPVLHHTDVLPQFSAPDFGRFDAQRFCSGLVLFGFGLAKKILLADAIASVADGVFFSASQGVELSIVEAWFGVLAYALQIYFDFSGYSDMARGLSRMLGIELPINFESPYRSTSLIDFWRRWHITLARFLRNYLYVPLGGSRGGAWRTSLNLLTTMALGGLWHGAGYGFLAWGIFHGCALAINHGWRRFATARSIAIPKLLGWLFTFITVMVGWVFFRAHSFGDARDIIAAMFGLHGLDLPAAVSHAMARIGGPGVRFEGAFLHGVVQLPFVVTCQLAALWLLALQPWNTNRCIEILDTRDRAVFVRQRTLIVIAGGVVFAFALASLGRLSPFLYYQF